MYLRKLRKSLRYAVDQRRVPNENIEGEAPWAAVDTLLTNGLWKPPPSKSNKVALTPPEAHAIIEALEHASGLYVRGQRPHGRGEPARFPSAHLGVLLAFYSGLRLGLIKGASTDNVVNGGQDLRFVHHKTSDSTGKPYEIPVTEMMGLVLARAEAMRNASNYRGSTDEDGQRVHYLFPGLMGLTDPSRNGWCTTFDLALADAVAKAGVKKKVTMQGLRAAYVSFRLGRGVDPVAVARAVNHVRISTTLDHYGETTPDAIRDMAQNSEAEFEALRRGLPVPGQVSPDEKDRIIAAQREEIATLKKELAAARAELQMVQRPITPEMRVDRRREQGWTKPAPPNPEAAERRRKWNRETKAEREKGRQYWYDLAEKNAREEGEAKARGSAEDAG